MKSLFYLLAVLFLTQGCKKDDSKPDPEEPPVTYINTTSGSSWTYHEVNSSGGTPVVSDFTITSTDKDTAINSRSYHVYNYSFGGSQYLSGSNNDYYEYSNFNEIGQAFERLYLKKNAQINTSWSQTFNISDPESGISVPVKVNNVIADITERTVGGTLYKDVIHVKTTLSSTLVPAGQFSNDINSYYAPSVGLIENTTQVNIDFMGFTLKVDLQTELTSSSLK